MFNITFLKKFFKAGVKDEDLNLDDLVTLDYLDVVKEEYAHERAKRQSFESRANIIMTFVGVLSVFIFEKIPLNHIFRLFNKTLTFNSFIEIISGIGLYLSLGLTIYWIIKCISIEKVGNFPIDEIDTDILAEKRLEGVVKLILTYKDIINTHRDKNNLKAINLNKSYIGSVLIVCFMLVYMTFKIN